MLLAVSWMACLSPAYGAQLSTSTLKGVDLFRSEQITAEQARAKMGPLFSSWLRLRFENRKSRAVEAAALKSQLEAKLRSMGDFAFVQIYYGEYANSAERSAYVTFDVVDSKDAGTRMPFRAAPHGRFDDPAGLLAVWKRYDELGFKLMGQGQISTDQPLCSGYYCRWGASTPELASLDRQLAQGAQANKDALVSIAAQDADPSRRAAALYVLSYAQDGNEIAKLMIAALDDPAEEARGAALQVISDLAMAHKSVQVDLTRVFPVLDYPTVSERGKVLGLLVGVADSPVYRPAILSKATAYLVPLLRLEQPANQELAFTLLSVLSQQSYGRRDFDAWQKWADAQAARANAR